jgi:hypothetical protein
MIVALVVPRFAAASLAAFLLAYPAQTAEAIGRSSAQRERVACKRDGHSVENSHTQRNNDLIRWRARWSGEDCSIDLLATGEVKFNADFTDIISVSNGGSLDITDVDGRHDADDSGCDPTVAA